MAYCQYSEMSTVKYCIEYFTVRPELKSQLFHLLVLLSWTHIIFIYLFVCLFWSHHTACRILVPQPNRLWLALLWLFALMQYSFYGGGPKLNSWHLWDVPVSVWVSGFDSFGYIFPRSGIPGSCIVLCLNFWKTDHIVFHSGFFCFFKKYLFIWLCQMLVAAYGIFDLYCSMWDL